MPTTEYEALAELFRYQPALAVALLRDVLGLPVPEHASFELPETDFTQTMVTEYRADRVVVLKDARGKAVLAVIVEVQRGIDPGKRTIDLGFGQRIYPQAVGPGALPAIRSRQKAARLPELTVLSALSHGNDEPDGLQTVLAAMMALACLDDERARFYTDLILARRNKRVRNALEAWRIQGYEYQSEFARKYYGQGKIEGKIETLLLLLGSRGLRVTRTQEARIRACTDLEQLDRWLVSAVSVPLVAGLFAPAAKRQRPGQ